MPCCLVAMAIVAFIAPEAAHSSSYGIAKRNISHKIKEAPELQILSNNNDHNNNKNESEARFVSILGDPGMKGANSTIAVAWSGWSFCNRARAPRPFQDNPEFHFSPRMADCVVQGVQRISQRDNLMGSDDPFPGEGKGIRNTTVTSSNVDMYARQKELWLANKCSHRNAVPRKLNKKNNNLQFNVSAWHVMFKSGNFNFRVNQKQGLCPCSASVPPHRCPPLYKGPGPMNQPLMVHRFYHPDNNSNDHLDSFGYFAGTYDVDPDWSLPQIREMRRALHSYTNAWIAHRKEERRREPGEGSIDGSRTLKDPVPPAVLQNVSLLFTVWTRTGEDPSTQNYNHTTAPNTTFSAPSAKKLVFYQGLQTSARYPWLMNYLRCNQAEGGYGGYPWGGFGMMMGGRDNRGVATSHTRMKVTLSVLQSDPNAHDQFYLPEFGGCWKLDGSPCDGELHMDWPKQDVTRYICFVAVPSAGVDEGCGPSPERQKKCPPYHILSPVSSTTTSKQYPPHGIKVYRNDTERFPYHCYFLHCYAANDPTVPVGETCDPYSNPNPQELIQLLPCNEWRLHRFPTQPILGTATTWDLDVGGLGARVFLQGQEPPTVHENDKHQVSLPHEHAWYPGWNRRYWISFEIGPEQMDPEGRMVRWEVEDWDVQIPSSSSSSSLASNLPSVQANNASNTETARSSK